MASFAAKGAMLLSESITRHPASRLSLRGEAPLGIPWHPCQGRASFVTMGPCLPAVAAMRYPSRMRTTWLVLLVAAFGPSDVAPDGPSGLPREAELAKTVQAIVDAFTDWQ